MSEALSTSSTEELILKHGILIQETQKFTSKVLSVLYSSTKGSYVILLRGAIVACQSGQQTTLVEELEIHYSKLLYASEYDRYVGVSTDTLYLLQNDFTTVLHQSLSEQPISCCLYNRFDNTIITAGIGYINIWRFHRGGKTLLMDQVIKEGLNEEGVALLHTEEVPGNAQRLFAVVGNGIKVYLLATCQLISEGKSLHSRPISAVLFFRPLTYLITGARDGSIKIWNQSWILQYAFISHQSPVTSLTPYPTGPCIISGSLDGTMRLWNLFHWDKVQEIDHTLPVHWVYSEPGHDLILSHSSRQVRTWGISELYQRTTIVGSPASYLSTAFHPLSHMRLVGIFADSTVRVVSPVGGAIVTTALLPSQLTITNVVYMPHQEWLFILTSDGKICKHDTSTKPSKKLMEYTPTSLNVFTGSFSCLALYQIVMDQEELDDLVNRDQWLSIVMEGYRMKPYMEDPLKREREGVHLIISGTDTGHLCVLDMDKGDVHCVVKAHSNPLIAIVPHPKRDQILSVTTDNSIKVWRVYPYTRESLVLMMSFSVGGVPAHLSVLYDRVCVTVNDTNRASYTNTMYSLSDKIIYSSNPFNNHTESITGLDVSTSLHLFVSCSYDCSIRTWSQDNNILRILQLDAPPTSIVFSSPFGGLTISLRSHLHTISHLTHLTEGYVKQLVSLGIKEEDLKGEESRPVTPTLESWDAVDQIRLRPIDDQLEVKSYRGALSEEELNSLDRIKEDKTQGMRELMSREEQLRDIRDGRLTARKQKSQGLPNNLKRKAWKEVFSFIRPLPPHGITIPSLDDFDPDTYGVPVEIPSPYEPFSFKEKHGFFPPLSKFDPPYPIAPDGFLPNSAILQKLRKSEEDKLLAKKWKPPTLTDKQRLTIENKVDEDDDHSSFDENTELMDRLRAAMMEQGTPEPSRTPTPPPTPPSPPRRELKTQMRVEKIVAPKLKPKSPPPKPRTPTPPPPPRTPTPPPPPPPPTPLPEYIAQFIGQQWFESLFPKATSKTIPRPWTVTRFVYMLLSCLTRPTVSTITRADICQALLKLIREYSPSNTSEVCAAILALLTGPPPISSQHMSERHLVMRGLQLLVHASDLNKSFMTLLMGYYAENNYEIKDLVMDYFHSKGVTDPHNYFSREMDTTLVGSTPNLSELMVKSHTWLDSWSVDYLKSKGVKIPPPQTDKRKPSLRSTKSQPVMKLPYCDPIEVINHFVRTEHERELARRRPRTPPPPPPEAEEDTPHNVVVPLPLLDHSRGCLLRLGETHCSKCHPDRETSLASVGRIIQAQRQVTESMRTLNLSMRAQNINPFLSPEERRELELIEQSRSRLMSSTKLFLLEQSYPT